jgi:hypothetical protein
VQIAAHTANLELPDDFGMVAPVHPLAHWGRLGRCDSATVRGNLATRSGLGEIGDRQGRSADP